MGHNAQPNPHAERLRQVMSYSESLGAKAGDLVKLNTEKIVPQYRKANKGEEYEYMISGFTSLASPYNDFAVLSCTDVERFKHAIDEVIIRGYQVPHPCYIYPCGVKGE